MLNKFIRQSAGWLVRHLVSWFLGQLGCLLVSLLDLISYLLTP